MHTILFYIRAAVETLLPLIPGVILLRLAMTAAKFWSGKRTTIRHELGAGVFLLCLLVIFEMTVPLDAVLRSGFEIQGKTNLVPFRSIMDILANGQSTGYILVNIVGNVLMFAPLGLFPPLLWKGCRNIWAALACGFGFSVLIETLQLFCIRQTDIDDVILNTLGALLGYGIFLIFRSLKPTHGARRPYQSRRKAQAWRT